MSEKKFNGMDGKKLLNLLAMQHAKEEGDDSMFGLLKIFDKYGLSMMDGLAMLLEISVVLNSKEGEENDGGTN